MSIYRCLINLHISDRCSEFRQGYCANLQVTYELISISCYESTSKPGYCVNLQVTCLHIPISCYESTSKPGLLHQLTGDLLTYL